jgi:glyoxylase-like metal-dependent hydrolase (beta-lactamase superfamily II)
VAAAALLSGHGDAAGTARAGQARSAAADAGIEVLQVRPNVFLLAGAGGNVVAHVGDDGVILVDTGTAAKTDAVLGAIAALSDKPIRYIINTGPDADHVGGNARLSLAGKPLAGGGQFALTGASIIATENVLNRMSAPTGQSSPYPVAAWPLETFTTRQKVLRLNHDAIEVLAMPAAHTDGDSLVMFRRADVIVTGDILDLTRFPTIDVDRGGSIQGEIAALNRLIELAIPSVPLPTQQEDTLIVPGHGRVAMQADVVDYRDMVTIVRDRVEDLMKSRMTLEQVTAAAPTQGWTTRYGAESAQAFVAAVYKSLTPKPPVKTVAPAVRGRGTKK